MCDNLRVTTSNCEIETGWRDLIFGTAIFGLACFTIYEMSKGIRSIETFNDGRLKIQFRKSAENKIMEDENAK